MTKNISTENEDGQWGVCGRFKFLRERHYGLRGKRKFADALQLPLSTYVNYEKDRIPPSEVVLKASQITGCDLSWLMTGHGRIPATPSPDPEISEILVRMEKILSAKPKAREAVNALMDLLSSQGPSEEETEEAEDEGVENMTLLPLKGKSIIPVLGRVAAGEPARWLPLEESFTVTFASILPQLNSAWIEKKKSLGELLTDAETRKDVGVIELSEPVALGPLMVDQFIVTSQIEAKGKLFGAIITGDSMEPNLREGDYVIADTQGVIQNGAIVLAELENCIGATCKIYLHDNTCTVLNPINPKHQPIFVMKGHVRWIAPVVGRIAKGR